MSIITLTTDYGNKDYFVSSLKAKIVSEIDSVEIIDISHNISPFNLTEAGYILEGAHKNFPKGTIHLICVDSELTPENKHIVIKHEESFFIGADNGFFSILLDDFKPDKIVSLNISQKTDYLTFASRDVFVIAACHLKRGGTLELIGKEIDDFRIKKNFLMPVIESNLIKGVVTYIDNYGNAITNIDIKTFEKNRRSRNFSILFGREDEEIKKLSTKYKEVEIAEKLAIFNSNNYLQISINQGNANSLLGLNFFDTIRIEFK